jgi:hypothetical protein
VKTVILAPGKVTFLSRRVGPQGCRQGTVASLAWVRGTRGGEGEEEKEGGGGMGLSPAESEGAGGGGEDLTACYTLIYGWRTG